MRTIKFRGKSLYNNEWVYGNLFQGIDSNGNICCFILPENRYVSVNAPDAFWMSFSSQDSYLVDINTVGQFTGITDRFGREIYEGDKIVKINIRNYVGTVLYENGEFVVAFDWYKSNLNEIRQETELEIINN